MKEFYFFMGGVASLFVAQLIFNYNFSDWVKDKVLALFGKGETAVKKDAATLKAEVAADIAKFKPKGKGK